MSLRNLVRCLLVVAVSLGYANLSHAEEEVVLTEEGEPPPKPSNAAGGKVSEANAGVMVRPFEGAKSQKLHESVVSAMESAGVILIPAGFEDGVSLADDPEPYVQVARKVGIKAFVHGSTTMSKKGWTLQLRVRNGNDGQIVAEPKLSAGWLPGLLKKIETDLMDVLQEPLSKTSLPAKGGESEGVELEAEVSPSDEDPNRETASRERSAGPRPPASPFDGAIAVGALMRRLTYNNGIGDVYEHELQDHEFAAPALSLGLHWYPGAHFRDDVLAHIGIGLSYTRSVAGATTVNAAGEAIDYDTTFSELNVGLRGRIPMRGGVELGLNAGWGVQGLVLEGDNETTPTQPDGDPGVIPDVEYTYFRFGPDVRFELGVPLTFGAFVRTISISDEDGHLTEQRWFPDAAGIGIDTLLSGEIGLTEELSLTVGGELRYYGIDANSGPYDENVQPNSGLIEAVAGGANDLYVGGFLGARFELAGSAR